MEFEHWANLGAAGCAVVALVWLVMHQNKVTIPALTKAIERITDKHAEVVDKLTRDGADKTDKMLAVFQQEYKEERNHCHQDHERMQVMMTTQHEQIVSRLQAQHEQVMREVFQQGKGRAEK